MRLPTILCTVASILQSALANPGISRTERWKYETLGEGEDIDSDMIQRNQAQVDIYKKNLLQYVLHTNEPRQVTGSKETQVPYIMDKLYSLLADKSTGREKRSAPFEVDLIRGLEDYYGKSSLHASFFSTPDSLAHWFL